MKRLGGGERQRSQCPIPYEMEPRYALTLWTGRVTASSSSGSGCHTASCSEVLHRLAFSFALNWHCAENHCATTCHGVSPCLSVCVCFYFCGGFAFCCMPPDERWPDRLSHVTYPQTAEAALSPRCRSPPELRERHLRSERKLHTLAHMKGGSRQSRTITGRQEPFRWKITPANQLLIESFSSASGQWKAPCELFPWNHSQSVASSAFTVTLILIKCNYSLLFLFFPAMYFYCTE